MDAAIWSILHIMSSNGFFRISIGKAQTAPRYPCASIIGRPFASTAREHIGLVHADPGVLAYDPTFCRKRWHGHLAHDSWLGRPWHFRHLRSVMGKMPMPPHLILDFVSSCRIANFVPRLRPPRSHKDGPYLFSLRHLPLSHPARGIQISQQSGETDVPQ